MRPLLNFLALAAALIALAPGARAARGHGHHDDQVSVFGGTTVRADETVNGDNVTVMASSHIDGHVTGDAVTVLGDCVVNGAVDGDVTVVMGHLTLGPNAHVGRNVVCIGRLDRDPDAYVGGEIQNQQVPLAAGPSRHFHEWWDAGLHRGQYLVFGRHALGLWLINLALLGVYALIAVLAPAQVGRCGQLLVDQPGTVLLAAIISLLALPFVFLLLIVTVVGIPIAVLVLPAACFLTLLFGHSSLYHFIGRRAFGAGLAPGAAVLAGGAIAFLVLMLPVLGIVMWLLIWFTSWGLGCAALFTRRQTLAPTGVAAPPPATAAEAPTFGGNRARPGFVAPPPPSAAATGSAFAKGEMAGPAAPEPPPLTPSEPLTGAGEPGPGAAGPGPRPVAPAVDASAGEAAVPLPGGMLPRAGFWIRIAGLAIDLILVGVLCAILTTVWPFALMANANTPGPFLFLCAVYAAIMWKVRGATIGGIICHLSVVRLDGRPMDWPTAIVRVLGCFVSLIVVGLGFIWVAFDRERQSWHDKIAGTTVVVPVRRQSLV